MRYLASLGAALAGAIICGPALALLCELTFVSIFYGSIYESTAGWAAIYVAGPIGLIAGFLLGGWLVLRMTTGNANRDRPSMKEAFVHE